MAIFKGIDVSRWQGTINWKAVKESGIDFVIIKAGGSDAGFYTDSKFEQNYAGAKTVGIPVGAYYFVGSTCLNKSCGEADAKRFIDILKGKQFERPVYIDIETTPTNAKAGATEATIAFCETMEKAGYYCGIYASDNSGFKARLEINRLTPYDKWVAIYGSEPKYVKEYGMWQSSSTGRVNGINGNVDMNVAYKDYPFIIKKAGLNGFEKQITETKPAEEVEKGPKMYKKGVATLITKNFKSTEFDCKGKGCCSETPVDDRLVMILQKVRDHFGVSVNVNCGYRCKKHNSQIAGAAKASKHMEGIAADIVVKGIAPMRVARYIESIPGFVGRIGCYTWDSGVSGFVHVDTRGVNGRGIYTENNYTSDEIVSFSMPISKGSRGRLVKVMQRQLKKAGLYTGAIDGIAGTGTDTAIVKWNAKYGRTNDHIWGPKCWDEAFPM